MTAQRIRIGIAGLGQGGRRIVSAAQRHLHFDITAAADPDPELRQSFAQAVPCALHSDIAALATSPTVDLVYVATPTQFHAEHTLAALAAGKHVIVEKPMALSMAEANSMVAAADSSGLSLMVGHSQSFEPAIRAMRDVVTSGQLGPLRMIQTTAFTDWLYRPRTPAELDTALGGGVVFRQGSHQIDIIRWIGGGMVRSVRAGIGRRDASRPGDGSHVIFLEFDDGTLATATYSGYGRFDTTELTSGIGEEGRTVRHESGAARRALEAAGPGGEAALKRKLATSPGTASPPEFASTFGPTIVSCERGDIRQIPEGLRIYGDDGETTIPVPPTPTGRDLMLDEAYETIANNRPPAHDARWGRATLEVILATLESAQTHRDIALSHQVPTSH